MLVAAYWFGRHSPYRENGYVIYPGKLTVAPSFRIGCIGHLGADEMRGALPKAQHWIVARDDGASAADAEAASASVPRSP